MTNLYYHVKATILGNNYAPLGTRILATFEEKIAAIGYADRYDEDIPPEMKAWIKIGVWDDYGRREIETVI